MIYCILFAMVVLTSLTTLGYFLWNLEHGDELWYLCRNMRKDGVSEMFADLCEKGSWSEYPIASLWPTFFILYNNFLPISLYVTVELVNVAQAYFVDQDINMYHKEQNTPALARTSNMNGDLGQIEYIFSDKTGTLTCNEMTFRRFSMGTRVFGAPLVGAGKWSSMTEAKALVNRDPVMKHIAQLLSTCHNVVMEDGKYMAESPDEEALVEGAVTLGLEYIGQTGDKISVRADDNSIKKFTLLALIPFSSARTRMSVVVKDSADSIWLYTKGADNIMFDRTASNGFDVHCGGKSSLDKQLEVFAAEGLRTLVLGYRNLSAGEASKWCAQWKQATESLVDREGAMALVASKLEKDLILLGGTGIEDKLQDGVPNAIANIKKAGVKVWVLTGDKMTTAIEIGLSCKLLTRELDLIVLEKEPPKDSPHYGKPVTDRLATAKRTFLVPSQNGKKKELGLVVDGPSLLDILADPEYKQNLLDLACSCVAVVACRVSPAQKQLIVKMVKDGLPYRPITLSIGDGANDVPMIQEAQIGVGISGKEGRQAVNSSDFAIAQFRFLETLLLVHGRWNYRRISKVIVYSFYKNIVLTIVLAWWTNDCGYSGQSLYESYVYAGYNFFLGMPILLLGMFDQDVTAITARRFQKLYYIGLEKRELNVKIMVLSFLQACVDAAIIYYISVAAFNGRTLAGDTGSLGDASPPNSIWGENGDSLGLYVFGAAVFTNMVLAMLVKVALMHASWNWTTVFGLVFSLLLYGFFIMLYGSLRPDVDSFINNMGASYDFYNAPQKMINMIGFWISATAVVGIVSMIDLAIIAIQSEVFTSKTRSAREVEAFQKEEHFLPGRRDVKETAMEMREQAQHSTLSDEL
jgi:phospholipid-transporting ATPase